MNRAPTVVVTDGFWPKTLVAVRSLAAAGERVVCGEQSWFSPGLFSRGCARRFRYADPVRFPERFIQKLETVGAKEHEPVLMPMEEETLLCVLRHRARLEKIYRIPFASLPLIERLRDKGWLAENAERFGFAIPRTRIPKDERELSEIAKDFGFPLVVKLRISSGARGVYYAENESQLREHFRQAQTWQERPLVQERLPAEGEATGVSLLLDAPRTGPAPRGFPPTLVAAFVHRRLRQYPVSGGSSTLREPIRDQGLVRRAAQFLAELGFHGVAMLEFKRDVRTGRLCLLEINPRFWGSLHQAVLAGVPFPRLLASVARRQRPAPVLDYRLDLRSRALIPGDVLHYLRVRPRPRWRSFWRIRDPFVQDEALSWSDVRPVFMKAVGFVPLLTAPGIRHLATRPDPRSATPKIDSTTRTR